jgi:translocator protein
VGSGLWVNTGDGWYRSLNKPTLQPPDFIFGLLWPPLPLPWLSFP